MIRTERCCRELGDHRRGWSQCKRRATTTSPRWIAGAWIFLPYCTRHGDTP